MILIYIIISLSLIYSCLILYYWRSWKSIPDYTASTSSPHTRISVVIPARNEEENIIACLKSVCDQDYPVELLQIIVVDDSSTDKTWDQIQHFFPGERELFSLKLTEEIEPGFSAYKKRAVQTGIAVASGKLIVTTDADCEHSSAWLKTIASFYEEKNPVFIAAPVVLTPSFAKASEGRPNPRLNDQVGQASPHGGEGGNNLLFIFQQLDFMVLQGITAAAVHKKNLSMSNGANLAYEKDVFAEVNGFEGIDHIASGDDMLLMHKIATQHPDKVHYLKSKDTIVSTQPMKTWKDFFNQRIRWASKAKHYKDKRIVLVLLLVYLFNLSFLFLLVAGFWFHPYWIWLAGLWIAKTIVELPFVYSLASFFGKRSLVKYFFFFQPLHILYTIVSGLFGQFGRYEWKGRRVR